MSTREPSRITDAQTVKFFVLYVLQALGGHATLDVLNEVAMMTERASYFDYVEALEALIETQHIAVVDLGEQGTFYANTVYGTDALEHFSHRVPGAVQKSIAKEVLAYRARLKYESEIQGEVQQTEGGALATVTIREKEQIVFSATLRMPTVRSANELIRRFKSDPSALYGPVVLALSQLMDAKE